MDAVFSEDQQKWTYTELPLIRWLARHGIGVEWCTLVDLHDDPGLLAHYRLVVNVGHMEYVSREMRDHVVEFVTQGGNAAFFAGTSARGVCGSRTTVRPWSVTLADLDPTGDPGALTVNWPDALAGEMTGVAWSGYVLSFAADDDAGRERMQYVVEDEGHWVFAAQGWPMAIASGSTPTARRRSSVRDGRQARQLAVRVRDAR